MKQSELEALPITNKVMFGSDMVWDDNDERWWIGLIDGVPHRRRFGGHFFEVTFTVKHGDESAKVRIPFVNSSPEMLLQAAREWGSKNFGCSETELEVTASS